GVDDLPQGPGDGDYPFEVVIGRPDAPLARRLLRSDDHGGDRLQSGPGDPDDRYPDAREPRIDPDGVDRPVHDAARSFHRMSAARAGPRRSAGRLARPTTGSRQSPRRTSCSRSRMGRLLAPTVPAARVPPEHPGLAAAEGADWLHPATAETPSLA